MFHESHEEDEQNRSGGNSDDDRDHHNSSADVGVDLDISVADCNLSDYLIVEACYEGIQFLIDFTW